jgi:adenylate kinase family enzyme
MRLGGIQDSRTVKPAVKGCRELERMIAVVGPPAAGKTTLTTELGTIPGCTVFRLREHVPPEILAATAANPDRVDWVDDLTVALALRGYVEQINSDEQTHTVLLDNFPGSGTQVRLLLGILRRRVPRCVFLAVELVLDERTRQARARGRRVCHTCEHDPAHDPRLPAAASSSDPWKCGRCGGTLHPRRGDAPRLIKARTARFRQEAPGLRHAFTEAGIDLLRIDATREVADLAAELSTLIPARSLPS